MKLINWYNMLHKPAIDYSATTKNTYVLLGDIIICGLRGSAQEKYFSAYGAHFDRFSDLHSLIKRGCRLTLVIQNPIYVSLSRRNV